MKIVKVKTHSNSEIFINLDHIDYVNPNSKTVTFSNYFVVLNDESMKKVVDLIEKDGE